MRRVWGGCEEIRRCGDQCRCTRMEGFCDKCAGIQGHLKLYKKVTDLERML